MSETIEVEFSPVSLKRWKELEYKLSQYGYERGPDDHWDGVEVFERYLEVPKPDAEWVAACEVVERDIKNPPTSWTPVTFETYPWN